MEQQTILQNMGHEIVNSITGEWSEISYTFKALASTASGMAKVTREGGETTPEYCSNRCMMLGEKLRAGMYQEGRGTWFSMTYTIQSSGKYNVDFNYDDRPGLVLPPSAREYAHDLENFPRHPENIPDWLREKLREAETEQD
jgi:hypothetical protein